MKRTYVRPTMVGERFVANEYVAACGEENKVYKFNCNAPRGQLYYYPSSDGTIDGKYTGTDRARWWVIIIHVMQSMKQVLQVISMMDL